MLSQQSLTSQDPEGNVSCCKNHPSVPSRFFLTEHPELRYCKTCALNMALCGRKIERELSPEEHQRKLIVDSVVDRLRTNIGNVEANEAYYKQLLSMVELSAHSIGCRIEAIDAFIRRLAQTKLQLETEFENQLEGRAKVLRARREELGTDRLSIRQQLEDIESNFGSIIEAEDPQRFATLKTGWTELIAKTRRDLLTEVEFSFERSKIGESVAGFEREFKEIGKLRVLELVPLGPFCQDEKENGRAEGREGDFNCLRLVEELKLNLNANAQSKAKGSSRKNATTERESKGPKKGRTCEREEAVPPRRLNH